VVPAAGGATRALTDKLDRAVTSFAFTESRHHVTVEDDRTAYPARVDLKAVRLRVRYRGAFVASALARQEAIRHSSSRQTTRLRRCTHWKRATAQAHRAE